MGLPHHLQAPAFEQREEVVPVGAFGGIYPSLPFAQSAFVEENEVLKVPFVQLFNLANDPHEDKNLAAKHPERVSKMVALLKNQIENGRSTLGPKLKNDKNARIVYTKDRRLPAFVRERLIPSRKK